jgi:hypothetical protein
LINLEDKEKKKKKKRGFFSPRLAKFNLKKIDNMSSFALIGGQARLALYECLLPRSIDTAIRIFIITAPNPAVYSPK